MVKTRIASTYKAWLAFVQNDEVLHFICVSGLDAWLGLNPSSTTLQIDVSLVSRVAH
jgi:hypothetical protein